MAVYNELQVGRYVRFLQKFFGIKGRQPAPLTFSGEVGAVLSLFHGAENRYLEGWQRFATVQSIAAGGAGNNSVVRLRNPSGSGVIAVVEKLMFTNSVAFQPRMEIRAINSDLLVVGAMANARFDARGAQTPSLILSSQNTAAFGLTVNFFIAILSAATGGFIDVINQENQEIPILPGDSITVLENGTNTSLNVNIFWRERVLEESERT